MPLPQRRVAAVIGMPEAGFLIVGGISSALGWYGVKNQMNLADDDDDGSI